MDLQNLLLSPNSSELSNGGSRASFDMFFIFSQVQIFNLKALKLSPTANNTVENTGGYSHANSQHIDYNDPLYDRCNAIVQSWIMSSVAKELRKGIVFSSNTQKVWIVLKTRFDKGVSSVSVYFSNLNDLWDEFESLIPEPCDCERSGPFVEFLHQQKLMKFLIELNDTYAPQRSQILMMHPTPSLDQTYSTIIQEESQRKNSGLTTQGEILGSAPVDIDHTSLASILKLLNKEKGPDASTNMTGNSTTDQSPWIIDTGASNHIVLALHLLSLVYHVPELKSPTVHLPNGNSTKVTHTGLCTLPNSEVLYDVLYVPEFQFSLLSISRYTKELNSSVHFYPDFCVFQDLFGGMVKGIGKLKGGLYILNPSTLVTTSASNCVSASVQSNSSALWHQRLGLAPLAVLKKIPDLNK
uniref:Retrovirus-related Pol polyprotein from transposon TNT 1-94-like beta-barrel domain-containing protein n=1 Tax=Nicotiana tabacum TaxID=4097 RepID=A0A1S3YAW4_TOBAC|nr:PREDICTED: uncharacterized protein LOC107774371 [Nicotiana tabacum]